MKFDRKGPSRTCTPSGGDTKATSLECEFNDVPGMQYTCYCDCFIFSIADIHVDDDSDADAMNTAELVQGRYWRVGSHNGYPVYRQEAAKLNASVGVNDKQLVLYKSKVSKGWFVSSDTKEHPKTSTHYAWCPDDGSKQVIDTTKVHIPYWAKKPTRLVHLVTQHEYSVGVVADLLDAKLGRASSNVVGTGGWFNKAASLTALIKRADWAAAEALANTFVDTNELFATVVHKKSQKRKHDD
jgi:hypothetical protein